MAARAISPFLLISSSFSTCLLRTRSPLTLSRMSTTTMAFTKKPTFFSSSYSSSAVLPFSLPKRTPISIGIRAISTPSSSAESPYRYADRIIFPQLNSGSNSTEWDWTPPLRIPCMHAEFYHRDRNCSGDGRHWLVFMDMLGLEVDTEQELFDYYIKILASAVGSEAEAKKKIYLVSCGGVYGFGAEFDEKTRTKLEGNRNVVHIFEDSSYYTRNEDPNVQSESQFVSMNWNCRLDNIFSYYHVSEPNSQWNSDHWLINIKQPDGGFTNREQITDFYIKMLAEVVGSEEAAVQKIYIIWFKFPFGFGAELDEETSNKLRGLPKVIKVLPDYAFDIKANSDFHRSPLNIYPSSRGLRFSHCRLSEEYDSEDWLTSMEEHLDESGKTYSPVTFLPTLSDLCPTESERVSDCKHWYITMEKPGGEFASIQQRIDCCLRTIASAVGSEEEAKKKIYKIKCGSEYFGFGIEMDEETSNKLTGMLGVVAVFPDDSIDKCQKVESVLHFTPINLIHLLNDIFSYHHLSERNLKWNSDHWLIHIKKPKDELSTEQQIIDFCVRMLAEVVGSEEDAKKKIYALWCKMPFGFGVEIDKESSNKLKALPDVVGVLPDYAFDVKNRNHGVLVISPSSCLKADRRTMYYYPLVEECNSDDSE